jgi:hypothetical protein
LLLCSQAFERQLLVARPSAFPSSWPTLDDDDDFSYMSKGPVAVMDTDHDTDQDSLAPVAYPPSPALSLPSPGGYPDGNGHNGGNGGRSSPPPLVVHTMGSPSGFRPASSSSPSSVYVGRAPGVGWGTGAAGCGVCLCSRVSQPVTFWSQAPLALAASGGGAEQQAQRSEEVGVKGVVCACGAWLVWACIPGRGLSSGRQPARVMILRVSSSMMTMDNAPDD